MTTDVLYLSQHRRPLLPPLVVTIPLCDNPAVSTVCTCGGLLAYVSGEWRHVEACIECYDSTHPCPSPGDHTACATPDPVACAHADDWQCDEPVSVDGDCGNGGAPRSCCRCCWVETDDAEGRVLWPR